MNTIKHKKVRTLKDLQNHPLVAQIAKDYNPEVFANQKSDYTYWLYLKIGYYFDCQDATGLHEPTVKDLISVFNDAKISLDQREGWRLEDQI
jgi:hypothetical protein|tara:strand:+ start:82 stop:357 length:276 start_codon:yes stop_codon:yes gene_type:complete